MLLTDAVALLPQMERGMGMLVGMEYGDLQQGPDRKQNPLCNMCSVLYRLIEKELTAELIKNQLSELPASCSWSWV